MKCRSVCDSILLMSVRRNIFPLTPHASLLYDQCYGLWLPAVLDPRKQISYCFSVFISVLRLFNAYRIGTRYIKFLWTSGMRKKRADKQTDKESKCAWKLPRGSLPLSVDEIAIADWVADWTLLFGLSTLGNSAIIKRFPS